MPVRRQWLNLIVSPPPPRPLMSPPASALRLLQITGEKGPLEPMRSGPAGIPRFIESPELATAARSEKKKCSGTNPCTTCVARGVDCLYLTKYGRGRPPTPTPAPTLPTTSSSQTPGQAQPVLGSILHSRIDHGRCLSLPSVGQTGAYAYSCSTKPGTRVPANIRG